jgi:uncharacterized protein DUF5753
MTIARARDPSSCIVPCSSPATVPGGGRAGQPMVGVRTAAATVPIIADLATLLGVADLLARTRAESQCPRRRYPPELTLERAGVLRPVELTAREYASEVLRSIRPDAPAEEIQQRLELRMHRQELLTQTGRRISGSSSTRPPCTVPSGGPG